MLFQAQPNVSRAPERRFLHSAKRRNASSNIKHSPIHAITIDETPINHGQAVITEFRSTHMLHNENGPLICVSNGRIPIASVRAVKPSVENVGGRVEVF